MKVKEGAAEQINNVACTNQNNIKDDESKSWLSKQQVLFEQQQRHIQVSNSYMVN